jgi:serine/threonine protein kinase
LAHVEYDAPCMDADPPNPGLDTWRLAESLFAQAKALPPGDRAALIANLHADDPVLAGLLESLLAADDRPDPLLDNPDAALGLAPATGLPAATFGQYELLGVLGEGRSGVVYRARQRSLNREVALKALAATLGSGQASRRFATEALALRTLRHPNIVPILDAGTVTEAAGVCRPFLTMELVAGLPITEHCRLRDLPLEDRLHLVLQLCAAAAFAHRHGVLHRDLSPANILVETDEAGDDHVRVIDFGLARFLDVDDRATLDGHPLGTPGFMSPEQARGDGAAIDTRTDVFSIGAILAALVHQEDVAGHTLPVSDDLSLIIGIAMRESPDERYQTVESFAADLRALLEHRPIAARPPSATYQLSKYVRRHPARAAAAIVTVSALTLATVAVGVSWNRTVAAERDAANAGRLLLREVSSMLHNRVGAFAQERRVLESLLPRLDPFAARYLDDLEIQSDLATLLGRLGDCSSMEYDHATALRHWERSLEIRRRIATARPDDHAAIASRSIATVRVGDEAGHLGDFARQRRLYLEALDLDLAAVAQRPDDPHLVSNLASSHERVGALDVREGQWSQAMRRSDLQLEAARRVEALEGQTRRAVWDVAAAHAMRASLKSLMLERHDAAEARTQAMKGFTTLVERDPTDRDACIRLASVIFDDLGTADASLAALDSPAARVARQAIDAIASADDQYHRLLPQRLLVAWLRTNLSLSQDRSPDLSELEALLRETETIASRDGLEAAIRVHASAANMHARVLLETRGTADAVHALRLAYDRVRRWEAGRPVTSDWAMDLALSIAFHDDRGCDDPFLAELISIEAEQPRRWGHGLLLLQILRCRGCHDAAATLRQRLEREIPLDSVDARRRLTIIDAIEASMQ